VLRNLLDRLKVSSEKKSFRLQQDAASEHEASKKDFCSAVQKEIILNLESEKLFSRLAVEMEKSSRQAALDAIVKALTYLKIIAAFWENQQDLTRLKKISYRSNSIFLFSASRAFLRLISSLSALQDLNRQQCAPAASSLSAC
jgi:hypothetical protein